MVRWHCFLLFLLVSCVHAHPTRYYLESVYTVGKGTIRYLPEFSPQQAWIDGNEFVLYNDKTGVESREKVIEQKDNVMILRLPDYEKETVKTVVITLAGLLVTDNNDSTRCAYSYRKLSE